MQALFDLAHHSHGQPVPLHAIAQRQELSLPFLEQIFNKLKKSGVVTSVRGPKGGYVLTRPCNLITVGEVLRLTDGTFYASARGDAETAGMALMADQVMSRLLWKQLQAHLTTFMDTVTIADLCSESESNSCPHCTCPEYVADVQQRMASGERRPCGVLG